MSLSKYTKYFTAKSFKEYYDILREHATKDQSTPRTILAALGTVVLIRQSFRFLGFVYRNFLRGGYDLAKRYGAPSWVVVTGASDGIGKAFAFEFASLGFNVVIIGRNKAKCEKVIEEIKGFNPKAELKLIVADFANSFKPGFYDDIYSELKDLDISVLVNNVGDNQRGLFATKTPKSLWDLVTVDTLPQSALTHMLIRKLSTRGKNRAAIINMSSIVSDYNFVYNCVYAAAKRFDEIQTRALIEEYGDKVDFLCLKPGWVLTQLAIGIREAWNATTAQKFVKHSLKQLAHENVVKGHWKHEVVALHLDYFLWYKIAPREVVKKRLEASEKAYNERKQEENKATTSS